jgi:carboxyl-terminal processing protease
MKPNIFLKKIITTGLITLHLTSLLLGQDKPTKPKVSVPPDAEEAAYPAIERFITVMEKIRAQHPDVDKLTYDRLVNHALEGMLSSLDPHSSYIHPEMAAFMKSDSQLDPVIASLGITVSLRDSGPYISEVTPFSPAAKAKLDVNSSILRIGDQDASSMPFPTLLELLRRPAGEISRITVKMPTEPKPSDLSLTHVQVLEKAVTHAILLKKHPGIGYIRLAQFTAGCAEEMEAALDDLEDQGMKQLILDLRGNPGGDLNATVKLLGFFLPAKTAVVTVRTRNPADWETLATPENQRRKRDYPITVLIDRMSASASELTAACLQDLKRATIVGETSFGKGSVQHIIPMENGTALRMTVATYHSPSGRTPHGVGVTPDIIIEPTNKTPGIFSPPDQNSLDNWQDAGLEASLKLFTESKK